MNKFVTFICLLLFVSTQGQTAIFNSLLKKNVDRKGMVDYQSLKKNETIYTDGRQYIGIFVACDKSGSIIVNDALELVNLCPDHAF